MALNTHPMEPNRYLPYNQKYQMLVDRVELTNGSFLGNDLPNITLTGQLVPSASRRGRGGAIFDEALLSPFECISRVEVSGPCTIVYFSDGSKEIVRKTESDSDNLEIAVLYAVAKHCYGSNSKMHKHLYKLIDGALDRQEAREVIQQIRAEKKAKKKAEADKKKRRS